MRKIINDPDNFVDEVVDGILAAHPHMLKAVTNDRRALARADAPIAGQVGIVTGARTRKGLNLAKNPSCVISVALKGLDLVVEGRAVKVTDDATLRRLAKRYADQGWPATVKDGAFTAPYSAPSAGPPPWDLYVVTPTTAFGVATAEPLGATRWRFS